MKKIISIIIFACLFISAASAALTQEKLQNKFLVLTIDNKIISPIIADYISDGIDEAQTREYSGLIILMDTPGGLLESTRTIVKKIMNADIPVIVYVAPSGSRAGSAGVFITLAAHVAAMSPSTNIGAAHPVAMGEQEKRESKGLKKAVEELTEALKAQGSKNGSKKETKKKESSAINDESEKSTIENKIIKDTLAWVSTIAKSRNRNVEWARKAVTESSSLTDREALEQNVIDLIARDTPQLLEKIDGKRISFPGADFTINTKNYSLIYNNLTTRQNILNTLVNPNIAYLLMLLGFLGIFIEITHPGAIFPGIVGITSLIIAFYAFQMLPVNFAGFLLIALAVILFIAEALTPMTFGLLTLGGAVCMLIGSLMLIDSPFSFMRISLALILPVVLAVSSIVIFLVSRVVKTHRKKVASGQEALIGEIGVARTTIKKTGQVFCMGEIWTAINQDKKSIKKGEKVKVIGVDKIKLLVSKYET